MTLTPEERFKRWHWGVPYRDVIEIDDDRYPDQLVEIGRLMELRTVHTPKKGRRPSGLAYDKKVRSIAIEGDTEDETTLLVNRNYVFFDHNHPKDRIYFYLSEDVKDELSDYFKKSNAEEVELKTLASLALGHHADDSYPDVMVKPIGYASHIIYFTHKEGDEPPLPYIHEFAEENTKKSHYPLLGVSEDGNLWFAGGGYTCPIAGITD